MAGVAGLIADSHLARCYGSSGSCAEHTAQFLSKVASRRKMTSGTIRVKNKVISPRNAGDLPATVLCYAVAVARRTERSCCLVAIRASKKGR